MTRSEHLVWAKKRVIEYLDRGDVVNAWGSMCSDMSKHDELRGHCGLELGMMMLMAEQLETERAMRHFIEGFN